MKSKLRHITSLAILLVILLAVPSFAQSEFLENGESSIGVSGGFALARGINSLGVSGNLTILSRLDINVTSSRLRGSRLRSVTSTGAGGELFIIKEQLENAQIFLSAGAQFEEDDSFVYGAIGYGTNNKSGNGKGLLKLIVGNISDGRNSAVYIGAIGGTSVRHRNLMMLFAGEVGRSNGAMLIGASISITGVFHKF